MPQISVSSVSERDIDLLLLEEFVANREFQSWFVRQVAEIAPEIEACLAARRSVTQSNGESDLEILFQVARGRRLLLMVENKIAAGFQPMQAERYRSRGARYVEQGDCDRTLTIITAPECYFGESESCKGFDARITYETLLGWFGKAGSLGERRAYYKQAILQAAIDKSRLGYQPVEDAVATGFWRFYWEIAQAIAPELRMVEPGGKPAGSTFIYFKAGGLPNGSRIVHKLSGTKGLATGFVDLQLPGMGERTPGLDRALQSFLEKDMTVVRASNSAAIRLEVPTLDPNKEAALQIDDIKFGLAAAQRLLAWFRSHPQVGSIVFDSTIE